MLNQLYRDDLKAKEKILFIESLRKITQERSYLTLPKIGLKKTHSAPFKPSSNHTITRKVDCQKDKLKVEKGLKKTEIQNETNKVIIIDAETGNEIFITTAKWNAKEGAVSLNKSTILPMGTGRLDIKNRMKSIKPISSSSLNDKNNENDNDIVGYDRETSDKNVSTLSKYHNDSNDDESYADQNNGSNNVSRYIDPNNHYSSKYNDCSTETNNNLSVYNNEIDYIEENFMKSNNIDINACHPLIVQFLREGPLTPINHRNWSSRTNMIEMPLNNKKYDSDQNSEYDDNHNNNDENYQSNNYDNNKNRCDNIIDDYKDNNDKNNSKKQKPSTSISQEISNFMKKNSKIDQINDNQELYDYYFGNKLSDQQSEVLTCTWKILMYAHMYSMN
jgi:hypothetical protein